MGPLGGEDTQALSWGLAFTKDKALSTAVQLFVETVRFVAQRWHELRDLMSANRESPADVFYGWRAMEGGKHPFGIAQQDIGRRAMGLCIGRGKAAPIAVAARMASPRRKALRFSALRTALRRDRRWGGS